MKDTSVKDLDQLIQFRGQLLRFNRAIADEFQRIRQAWISQQDNWHDAQAERLDANLMVLAIMQKSPL